VNSTPENRSSETAIAVLRSSLVTERKRREALTLEIELLRKSTCWRITAPVRVLAGIVKRFIHLLGLPLLLVRDFGGVLRLFSRFWSVLVHEGYRGVLVRARGKIRLLSSLPTRSSDQHMRLTKLTKRTPSVKRHRCSVDIIVCVHNALEDTKRCLQSIVKCSTPPYQLIVVNDGSDDSTTNYLSNFVQGQGGLLLTNPKALGYTYAANIGLRHSESDLSILINSDAIVTPQWLDRLCECAFSATDIGIVGPLSNTASWQSVPAIFNAQGDWAENSIPEGHTIDSYALLIANGSTRAYPIVGFINGFCLLIKRTLIQDIGYFDETTFGAGYGEENDYCLRAALRGWRLAIADDVFVYHAQSKSYSDERRLVLSKSADSKLHEKHSSSVIMDRLALTKNNKLLHSVRIRTSIAETRADTIKQAQRKHAGRRLLFLLPVGHAGGGGNVVLSEAEALRKFGIDVHIANLCINKALFEQNHPNLGIPVVYLDAPSDLLDFRHSYDAVVATLYSTVEWLAFFGEDRNPVLGYYVQDYEPCFFPEGSSEYLLALDSYTRIPNLVRFTKTNWTREAVLAQTGAEVSVVGPSLSVDDCYPAQSSSVSNQQIAVTAMVRPQTPRRSPELTLRVLRWIKGRFQDNVNIHIFGVEDDDPDFRSLERDFSFHNQGILSSHEVAALLRHSDLFLDLSTYQAMGLTALEAMASGCAVVGPLQGGFAEIASDNVDCLLVDTANREACCEAAARLIEDDALRHRIILNAITHATKLCPEFPAAIIADTLFEKAEFQ